MPTTNLSGRERPAQPTTLIIVCCHAIYLNNRVGGVRDESNWLIEPFQAGETPTFTKHVEEGVRLLADSHGDAVLCFSGGATKRGRIREFNANAKDLVDEERTEAESYEDVAIEENLFGHANSGEEQKLLRSRIFQERFATDSYQNVLLALIHYPIWLDHCRQRESKSSAAISNGAPATMQLPRKIVIISHEFKRARFMRLHLPAIVSLLKSVDFGVETSQDGSEDGQTMSSSWNAQVGSMAVEYIGINPPFDDEKMHQIEEGDRKRGYGVWETDLHGVGELLSKKRVDRGWDLHSFLADAGKWFDERTIERLEDVLRARKVSE